MDPLGCLFFPPYLPVFSWNHISPCAQFATKSESIKKLYIFPRKDIAVAVALINHDLLQTTLVLLEFRQGRHLSFHLGNDAKVAMIL